MKEAPGSSETSVLTRATRRDNPEDTILQHAFKLDVNREAFWGIHNPMKCSLNSHVGVRARTHTHTLRSVLQLLVTVNVLPSSPILVTLIMETIRYKSHKASYLRIWQSSRICGCFFVLNCHHLLNNRSTFVGHRCENFKSYKTNSYLSTVRKISITVVFTE
jgi:hypothetical protein